MNKPSILIIDDEKSLRDSLTLVLAEKFNVDTSATGVDGMQKAKEKKYDVIFLDLHIDGADGFSILHSLKKSDPHNKIIIFSGTADSATVKKSFDFGADEFIAKPFELDEFQEKINKVLQ
jgi:DNA-binding response OmpR family regulator